MAGQTYDRLFVDDRVLGQHRVEVGTKPVGQVLGANRSVRQTSADEAAGDAITDPDPPHPVVDGNDLASAVKSGPTPSFVGNNAV